MLLTGAEIIMECLLEQGVDTVFGYPGGAVLNIYDAIYEYQDKIFHIRTAHEQGAAHAADGYARSTGKTGVCIATSGPGATNLVTGIATAYMDSVPMVAITGNVSSELLGLDSFQEVDITGITMPVTKHNYLVKHIEDLADTIRKAFLIAGTGRKGPVLVDIPKDITAQKYEYTPRKPLPVPKADFPYPERFNQAVEMLQKSERPFIYTGGGVIAAEAFEELKAF
ncbi:MAG: acetolactate synthase, large subunit, biosynthetic type, partial [Caproiciproducens sp.]|nr:acetolactate synthase, large subunit, biosynthetic type [Caproiciproducens sp.]